MSHHFESKGFEHKGRYPSHEVTFLKGKNKTPSEFMGHSVKADVGHEAFWQRRYFDRNVRDNEEFINDLKYIHRNPVKRGLVAQPEGWPWSSYRSYARHEQGLVTFETPWAAYKRIHPSADPNELSRIFAEE